MPFSRSRSIESITRSATSWFARKAPDCHSIASTSVVLPWSTCATIATLRMSSRARGIVVRRSCGSARFGGARAPVAPGAVAAAAALAVRAGGRAPRAEPAALELGVELQLAGDVPDVVRLLGADEA